MICLRVIKMLAALVIVGFLFIPASILVIIGKLGSWMAQFAWWAGHPLCDYCIWLVREAFRSDEREEEGAGQKSKKKGGDKHD